LQRRTKVPLHKKNQRPTKLRGRHFNYDLVEYTSAKKQPNIDVILTTYVEGIGRKGEIVNVGPTFAYDKLLLPGLAAYLTPANVEKYTKDADDPEEEKHSSPYAQRVSSDLLSIQFSLTLKQFFHQTAQMLEERVFAIIMNKDHPWVLEAWHIRVSLRKAAFIYSLISTTFLSF
jgi:large subunit ribosomal protein L9